MYTLIRSLKLFNNFVNGGRTRAFRRPLKCYDNNLEQLNIDFNQTRINHPDIRDYIETILENLCVPRNKSMQYFDSKLTIYEFLQELSKDGHIQANYFLELIDKKTKISKIVLFAGGLFSTGFAAVILSNPLLSNVLDSITEFVKSPSGIPILSALCTTGMAVYGIYTILNDGKTPEFNRARDLTFIILKSIVSLTAQALVIASSIAMTPIVAGLTIAGLYILSSVINMCKELFCLVQEHIQMNKPEIVGESSFYLHRAFLRHETASEKHKNAAIINFLTAVATIGVTTVSALVTGGVLVVAGVIASYALIYGLQYYMLKENDKFMREKLQDGIRNIINNHSEYNEYEMNERIQIEFQSADDESSCSQDESFSDDFEVKNTQATTTTPSLGNLSFFSKSSTADGEQKQGQQSSLTEEQQQNSNDDLEYKSN